MTTLYSSTVGVQLTSCSTSNILLEVQCDWPARRADGKHTLRMRRLVKVVAEVARHFNDWVMYGFEVYMFTFMFT